MVGGAAALAGAMVLRPRLGRFNADGTINDMPGHNSSLIVLGTFLLWFGWYGFNPGSTLGIHTFGHVAAKTAVTTTLSAASGAVANLWFQYNLPGSGRHVYDLEATCNGALSGLVVSMYPLFIYLVFALNSSR
jgi:Amt family ammonium transporter